MRIPGHYYFWMVLLAFLGWTVWGEYKKPKTVHAPGPSREEKVAAIMEAGPKIRTVTKEGGTLTIMDIPSLNKYGSRVEWQRCFVWENKRGQSMSCPGAETFIDTYIDDSERGGSAGRYME